MSASRVGDAPPAEAARHEGTSPAYSIRVVASRTGIPAETLRVWERRYGFPTPSRRAGGGRLYGDEDVARLRLIARARDAGFRPGDVMSLSDAEILKLVGAPSTPENVAAASSWRASPAEVGEMGGPPYDLDQLVTFLAREEVTALRARLRSLAVTLGPRAFVTDVAHPLMERVGEAWARGALAVRQEHVVSALVANQLRVLLAGFDDGEAPPIVVLATLSGEAHALGLDMVAVYLAVHRATPRVVGADTPVAEIVSAAEAMRADVVGISVSGAHDEGRTRQDLERIHRALEELPGPRRPELWIGGAGAGNVEPRRASGANGRVRVTTSWAAIDAALASIRASARTDT